MKYPHLQKTDPEIYDLIISEEKRQEETLMMIPSENIASKAVEEAVGSMLGNKYAEGYSGKRYYQGNEFVDQIETLVINRAKKLFGVPFVNVQPHSGSPANFAVYTAVLNPGDTLMGLSLDAGGHLTHGAKVSASGKYFNSVPYSVDENGYIDFDSLRNLAQEHKPEIIIAGTTAYPRKLDWKRFAEIAEEVGALLMADISHISGLIVGGEYPSPVEFADIITTTTHKTLRGPRAAMIMVTEKGLKKDPDLGKKINKAIIPGIQGGPHLNSIAAIGVALKEASKPEFKEYCRQTISNARDLSEGLSGFGFSLVSGGTDSHLILIDLRNKKILGNTFAEACETAGIILNRNGIPHDPNPPFYPSGIRLGTPGITSRGMKEDEMKLIASFLNDIAKGLQETKLRLNISDEEERDSEIRLKIIQQTEVLQEINNKVKELCSKFPIKEEY